MIVDLPTGVYTEGIRTFLCTILYCGGLWKPFKMPIWFQNVYSTYSVVLITAFSVIYTAAMVINIFLLTDFSELSERLFISLTEAACAIKIYNFFVNNREWQEILSELEDFRIKSPREEKILRKRTYIFQILAKIYYCNTQFTINALAVLYMFSGATDLMFSGWYPGFDWQNNRRHFWAVFVYQYVGVVISAGINAAIDSYYYFVMHILSAQANIVGRRLSSIRFDNSKGSIWSVRMNLIEQMTTHQRQNMIMSMIEENISWAYFTQVILSSIVICATTREFAVVSLIFHIGFNLI